MQNKFLDRARVYVGLNERDGTHRKIIDSYNTIKPLPVGYKMSYTDPWCAAFVSACAWEAGVKNFPFECSVPRMLLTLKLNGLWEEQDDYIPSPGDLVLYDWQDSGEGDNKGSPDHVGIVEKISGNKLVIIEGNYSDSVKRRVISVNGKYIRGFGTTSCLIEAEGTDVGYAQYVVKRGDCLWSIAKYFYGNGFRWKDIKDFNNLSSTLIYPGQILLIP